MKLCSRCGIREAAYTKNRICKECHSANNRAYYEQHGEQVKAKVAEYRAQNVEQARKACGKANKKRLTALRERVLDKYGAKCACCGESIRRFLTIDHVNNDGAAHRRAQPQNPKYLEEVLNDTTGRFQILCFNCNMGRAFNGGICPHKMDSEGPTTSP